MPTRREFTRASLGALGALALGRPEWPALQSSPTVNGPRLNSHLKEMSRFGANPQGGVSRVAYSEFDRQGREYALGLMRAARLEPRIDAAGNIIGSRPGSVARLKPIMFGSHIDSVPEGGNYDGTVGSLGAIEVAQTLAEQGVTTRHPLEVVIFQNEEGGTVGSRALIGELTDHDLGLTAKSGKTLRAGIEFVGGKVSELRSVLRKPGDVAAYVELHIEQGGNLDREKLHIGVVEGIVGISWWDVTIEGFANHAGTTAMNGRRDAMLAAARFTDMVNRVVTSEPGRQVGTVGRLSALPGVPNVIPGKVVCSLELRDLDNAKIDRLFGTIKAEALKIAEATGTMFSYATTHDSKSALTDPRIQKLVEASARDAGLTSRYLPSGAGHDAQHMARICPAGMIFVPSKDGISHAPQEYSAPQDIVNGANVLLRTVMALDSAPWT
jgi:N-carbamoyl-L-amino-acid hydrolase